MRSSLVKPEVHLENEEKAVNNYEILVNCGFKVKGKHNLSVEYENTINLEEIDTKMDD